MLDTLKLPNCVGRHYWVTTIHDQIWKTLSITDAMLKWNYHLRGILGSPRDVLEFDSQFLIVSLRLSPWSRPIFNVHKPQPRLYKCASLRWLTFGPRINDTWRIFVLAVYLFLIKLMPAWICNNIVLIATAITPRSKGGSSDLVEKSLGGKKRRDSPFRTVP